LEETKGEFREGGFEGGSIVICTQSGTVIKPRLLEAPLSFLSTPPTQPSQTPPPFSSDTSNKLILKARTVAFAAGRANFDCQPRCMIGRGCLATGARASGASGEAREFGFCYR